MEINNIYEKYQTMPLLKAHHFRVASVAMMICENISLGINKDEIIKACLLHDIGNIIKFNLTCFPDKNEPEGLDYWQNVKDEFINRYGKDEHLASIKIAEEIGMSEEILKLIDIIDPYKIEIVKNSDSFSNKICLYSDNRVSPFGIVSVEDRNKEARQRYIGHPHEFDENSSFCFVKSMKDIEDQIFKFTKLKPEDINDESISLYFEKLQNFKI